jgi:hypothetical protein
MRASYGKAPLPASGTGPIPSPRHQQGGPAVPIFDDRENAFEARFAHDAEMQFKAEARRNRLLGLWAAGILGKQGEEAAEYARDVVKSDFQEAGEEDVFRKIKGDLGSRADDATIRARMADLMAEAKAQIMSEAT